MTIWENIGKQIFDIFQYPELEAIYNITYISNQDSVYTPGSGNDPAINQVSIPIRAAFVEVNVSRTNLPEYEDGTIDLLILKEELLVTPKLSDFILDDENIRWNIVRIDNIANTIWRLMCKGV